MPEACHGKDRNVLISQIRNADGSVVVAIREAGGEARSVKGAESVYALALEAAEAGGGNGCEVGSPNVEMIPFLSRLARPG